MAFPGTKNKGEDGKSRFTIAFSLPMLVGAALVLVCAVAWAFYMGVMIGKGHNPQAQINDMTGGLLGENKQVEAQASSSSTQPASSTKSADTPVKAPQASVPPASPAQATTQQPSVSLAGTPQKNESASAQPFAKPAGAGLAAWGGSPGKEVKNGIEQTKAADAKAENANPKQQAAGPMYEYLFQAAAFKTQRDAENSVKKLKAAGFRCQSKRNGKVIVILVTMRGTQSEKSSLSQKLKSSGLGTPLFLSRKEIAQGKTGKNRSAKK